MVAASYGILLTTKSLIHCKNVLIKNHLKAIVNSIESIDSAIRKNISYFRESEILTGNGMAVGR